MSNSGRVAWNTATRWIAHLLGALVSMLIVPYVAGKLGLDGYGTAELMTTLVGFSVMADLGQRAAVNRHFAMFIVKEDAQGLNTYFNSALVSYGAMSLIVAAICWILGPQIVDALKIPANEQSSALLLVRYYVPLYTLMSFISPTYGGLVEAYHRFDIADFSHVAEILLRPPLFVALLGFGGLGLHGWAVAMLCCKAASLILLIAWSSRLVWIPIRLGDMQFAAMKDLWRLGGVMYLYQASGLLVTYMAPFALSAQLGPAAVALYRPAHLLTTLAFPFVAAFSRQFKPIMVAAVAQGNTERVQKMLVRGTRLTFMLGSLFAVMMISFGQPITEIWIGDQFGKDVAVTGWVLMLLAFGAVPKDVRGTQGFMALGLFRVRAAVIAQVVGSFATLAIGVFLIWFMAQRGYGVWSALGMAAPAAIISWLQTFATSAVVAKSMGVNYRVYFIRALVIPSALMFVVLAFGLALQVIAKPDAILELFYCMSATGLLWLALCWFFGLDSFEREQFGRIARNVMGRLGVRSRLSREKVEAPPSATQD